MPPTHNRAMMPKTSHKGRNKQLMGAMRVFTDAQKQEARGLYEAGVKPVEIASKLGCSSSILKVWATKYNWRAASQTAIAPKLRRIKRRRATLDEVATLRKQVAFLQAQLQAIVGRMSADELRGVLFGVLGQKGE